MNKTNSVTKGGMYTALSIIMLYLTNISPTSKLTFLAIAAAIIPLSILTTNIKTSVAVFLAVSVLGLILGLRGAAITYLLFFGLYGFIKYYIERLRKLPLEWLLKLVFFNVSFALMYVMYKVLFLTIPNTPVPVYLVIILMQAAFIVFDYAMTIIITYIRNRFIKL